MPYSEAATALHLVTELQRKVELLEDKIRQLEYKIKFQEEERANGR